MVLNTSDRSLENIDLPPDRGSRGDGSSGASVQTSDTVGRPHTYWMCPVPEISIQLLIQNDIIWFLTVPTRGDGGCYYVI